MRKNLMQMRYGDKFSIDNNHFCKRMFIMLDYSEYGWLLTYQNMSDNSIKQHCIGHNTGELNELWFVE